MSEGPTAGGEEPAAPGPEPDEQATRSPVSSTGKVPGLLALAAAVAGIVVYFTPPIWGLALPLSSIAMVLGLIGLLSNSQTASSRIMALLGLAVGIVLTVIVAVHLIQLPPR